MVLAVKIVRVLVFLFLVLVCAVALFATLFLIFWKPLGGSASRADKKDYASRASNFRGGKFHNDIVFSMMERNPPPDPHTFSANSPRPPFEFPTKTPGFVSGEMPRDGVFATWFGHSSVLVRMSGMNILFDPVFSEVISPVSFVGSRRFSHPPVSVADLPEIDILILSHDHYDHLDCNVIAEINSKVRRYVVPLGVENHLKRWGVDAEKIVNMAWWEETEIAGLTVVCTPAQHFSGRRLIDNMKTLWASWVLMDGQHKIFESGDSGFGPHFEKIHEKYGDFDFALIECGQYDKQWPFVHMFPEESVQAAKILGARVVQPIHWGAIVLSRHGWDDPVERFLRAAEKERIPVITPYIGERARIDAPGDFMERWWRTQ